MDDDERPKPRSPMAGLRGCYDGIVGQIEKYMDIDPKYLPLLGCWTLATWMHPLFNSFPYLYINATRGGGKTRLLKLLSSMAKDSDVSVNVSEAVVFRLAHEHRGLFLDEMEDLGAREKGALRLLLNAAYKRGMGVPRARKVTTDAGEHYEVERFDVFTPIAMANIWGMDDVLQDRSVTVILEKSDNPFKTKLLEIWDQSRDMVQLKRKLPEITASYVPSDIEKDAVTDVTLFYPEIMISVFPKFWAQIINPAVLSCDISVISVTPTTFDDLIRSTDWLDMETNPAELTQELCDIGRAIWDSGIYGRQLELFMPLLLVAWECGRDVFDALLAFAISETAEHASDDSDANRDTLLIAFLVGSTFAAKPDEYVKTSELAAQFLMAEDRAFITPDWIGRCLKRLALVRTKRRSSSARSVLLDWTKIERKARMLGVMPDDGVQKSLVPAVPEAKA